MLWFCFLISTFHSLFSPNFFHVIRLSIVTSCFCQWSRLLPDSCSLLCLRCRCSNLTPEQAALRTR